MTKLLIFEYNIISRYIMSSFNTSSIVVRPKTMITNNDSEIKPIMTTNYVPVIKIKCWVCGCTKNYTQGDKYSLCSICGHTSLLYTN